MFTRSLRKLQIYHCNYSYLVHIAKYHIHYEERQATYLSIYKINNLRNNIHYFVLDYKLSDSKLNIKYPKHVF